VEHAAQVADRMGVRPGDRVFVPVPLFWSYGGANALAVSLVTGSAIVLQETFDAGGALDLVERYGCTVAYTLPNITQALLDHPFFAPERVASLRGGMTIGAPRDVRAAAEELAITEICNAYGSTELYGGAAVTPHNWSVDHRCTSQGLPLPGMRVRILDPETGAEMPAGEPGEVVVAGHVTPGYLDQPEETAAAFTPDGAFRTGDLGYLDRDGELHFVGRASEMIRTGGINISPLEVEDFLLAHPTVLEAVVVGADDAARGQVAIAFVRVGAAVETDEEELRAFCRERIASYKVPARIVVRTAELPRTTTGKLARADLRADAAHIWRG
jgi:fatty-acyl-CoA synthase